MKKYQGEFTPIEVSREIGVTNKTVMDICYSLPDRIESFTNGHVRDNGCFSKE